jgi:hypothetical protein
MFGILKSFSGPAIAAFVTTGALISAVLADLPLPLFPAGVLASTLWLDLLGLGVLVSGSRGLLLC